MTLVQVDFKKFFLGLLVLLSLALLLFSVQGTNVVVGELSHAVAHNHTEIDDIRQCLNENGVYKGWHFNVTFTKDGRVHNRLLVLCKMPNGGFGIYILEEIGNVLEELTGFIRTTKSGKLVTSELKLLEYLSSTGWSGPHCGMDEDLIRELYSLIEEPQK